MRGLHTIRQQLQRINNSRAALVSIFVFSVALVSGLSPLVPSAGASGGNDIVAGGVWNGRVNCGGDVGTIMAHYRIDCNLAGVVDGRACRDGNVYVGDRVVARDSRSIGREPIQGNRPISIGGQTYYETHNSQALLSNCLDAFVKLDSNGSFTYAIIKACGNPIWTPSPVTNSPPPQQQTTPQPTTPAKKYKWVCELATGQIRYVSEERAEDDKYGPKEECSKKIKVCIIKEKRTTDVSAVELKTYPSKYSTDLSDCDKEPEPTPLTVCDIKEKTMVSISQEAYDKDKSRYSPDSADCKEAENPKAEEELPQTGIEDSLIGGGLGIGSLIVAGSAYIGSRKDWLSALLNR